MYFSYDAVGDRTHTLAPRGYATGFGFDALNRLECVFDGTNVVPKMNP
jgi:hypothetical protein